MKALLLINAIYILLACGNNNTSATGNNLDTLRALNIEDKVVNTDTTLNFEESTEGSLPKDWVAPTGKWMVVKEENNKVLKQSAP